MSPLARVLEEAAGDVAVVRVDGEIDASNAADIGSRMSASLTNRSLGLVVDLSATTYLDSAGLNMLFELAELLRRRQQQLHLVVDPASAIARMMRIAGLDGAVPTHATGAAAIAQVSAGD